MTLDKLNMLLVLAEEQNVTRAAERLFITQPSLTIYLNKLENKLGFRIFDRTQKPIVLTRDGKEYIETMQNLLVHEQKLIEEIRARGRKQPTIRMGIGHVNGQLYMPDLVERLLSSHNNLNIVIREGHELQLMELLKNDDIDLLFGHLPIELYHFAFEELGEQELFVAIPENLIRSQTKQELANLLEKGSDYSHPYLIDPSLLSGLPLISPSNTQMMSNLKMLSQTNLQGLFLNLQHFLEQNDIESTRIIQTENMMTATSMLQKGLGYMFTGPSLIKATRDLGKYRILYCTLPRLIRSRKYYIGYDRQNPILPLIQEARDSMRSIMIC